MFAVDVEPACVERLRRRYAGRENVHALVCDVLSPEFRRLKRFRHGLVHRRERHRAHRR